MIIISISLRSFSIVTGVPWKESGNKLVMYISSWNDNVDATDLLTLHVRDEL